MPVVEATGTATLRGAAKDVPPPYFTADIIQDAMSQAAADCAAEGITDDATILARKIAARDAVTGA